MVNQLPFVSFIVPTYRRPEVLPETLGALLRQDYPADRYEVIVVDDGSGDDTPEVVARYQSTAPALRYQAQPNSGVARARNEGARLARGDVLIFVDDDIIVAPDLIRMHLVGLEKFAPCLVNGHWEFTAALTDSLRATPFGRFRIKVEDWVKAGIEKKPLYGNYLEPEGVTACNLAVRREHFWHVGGFDEDFPYAGCEDQEFSLRAAQAGYRFVYQRDMLIWHNDRRLTLRQFCERQKRGAITLALLAGKHAEKANHPMVVENSPISVGDSPRLVFKKLVKGLAATRLGLMAVGVLIAMGERVYPNSHFLHRLYWTMCGLYIFLGIHEGVRRYGPILSSRNTVESGECINA